MRKVLKYSTLCFLLMLGVHLLGAPSGAETDSTKKYPLNDPRNPDCPCHKYQAQADQEYAKLLGISGQKTIKIENEKEGVSQFRENKGTKKRRWRRPPAASHKMKVPKRKSFRDRLSRCFHF